MKLTRGHEDNNKTRIYKQQERAKHQYNNNNNTLNIGLPPAATLLILA